MRQIFKIPPGFSWQRPDHVLAFGFGSGLFRKAPGTWGSAVALIPFIVVYAFDVHAGYVIAAIVVFFFLGILVSHTTAKSLGEGNTDYGGIVVDEWLGVWITLLALPDEPLLSFEMWAWILIAFALFRLLDIAKPPPIGWLDRNVKGGLGVMLDDAVAGIGGAILLLILQYFF